jgi:homoserine dehydrogenase
VGELLDDNHVRGRGLKQIPLVLLGFGKVGQAFAALLEEQDGFCREGVRLTLVGVCDRSGGVVANDLAIADIIAAKKTAGSLASVPGLGRQGMQASEVLSRFPDAVLVDASPTNADSGEPGLSQSRHALDRGHSAVLASKGPLVAAFSELLELARLQGCRIGISAAIGTPLPSLEVGHLGSRGSTLHAFRGIFNTTANRILMRMEAGVSYEDALKDAERAGVLEADPRLDVEGWDTAFKVLILARSFWSPAIPMESMKVQGITRTTGDEIARALESGRRLRLVGAAQQDRSGEVSIRVGVESLSPSDPLYSLALGEKGAEFETSLMGRFFVKSGQSGPGETAAVLVKDILNIAAHPTVLAL